jgi:hypothetical protein
MILSKRQIDRVFALAAMLALIPTGLSLAENQPALSTENFDFGYIVPNASYGHAFWLKASGDDTLTVTEVKNCCGVAVSLPTELSIAPGDSLEVSTNWQTRGFIGRQKRSVYFYFEPATEPLEVILSGYIVTKLDSAASLVLTPDRIDWPAKTGAGGWKTRIRLDNRLDYPLVLGLVEKSAEFGVDLPDSLAAGASGVISVFTDGTRSGSEFEGSVTLEIEGNQSPPFRLSIPIRQGDFSFRPDFTTNKE